VYAGAEHPHGAQQPKELKYLTLRIAGGNKKN